VSVENESVEWKTWERVLAAGDLHLKIPIGINLVKAYGAALYLGQSDQIIGDRLPWPQPSGTAYVSCCMPTSTPTSATLSAQSTPSASTAGAGIAFGAAAYIWWGMAVFWFKAINYVPEFEILAHRILWSSVFLVLILVLARRGGDIVAALSNWATARYLLVTASLITCSWFLFLWAVVNDRVLDTSLAYFINPLLNVVLGVLFLGERLRRAQLVAVLLAVVGVTILTVSVGQLPWLSLIIALTFAVYGLLRKRVRVDSIAGLASETVLLLPFTLLYFAYLAMTGKLAFGHIDRGTDGLLALAGIVTAVPLIWFVAAAKRLQYASLGLLMYIMPTLTFVLAVFVFDEPFGRWRLISFLTIWIGLAIYSVDSLRQSRRPRPVVPMGGGATN
jgi:chloramphenicol-sensitive protein RarD